jgi:2-polyprenyl-3-methyl-5-hydroxy-6-metoxy-1,4-benzoquinol methylase
MAITPEIAPVHDADTQRHLFRKSIPMQTMLHETVRSLGESGEMTCLDIGARNGAISQQLRKRGGTWHSVVADNDTAAAVRAVVPENVSVIDGTTLPFKKQMFDAVVIFEFLERVQMDENLIEECHRVLKPDGRLIVSVPHIKSWTMLETLRPVFGLTYQEKGQARAGYTESQLFNILKNGFDVLNMRTYRRFFLEFTDMVVQTRARRKIGKDNAAKKLMRLYSFVSIFYWLADQLDMFLFLTRGHVLIATAKRRAWRPRNVPVLVDGRSISEAVLSKALD